MPKFLSNTQPKLTVGIKSSTESKTVLGVTGRVGIGTTNAQGYSLYVVGDTNINGNTTITGSSLLGNVSVSSGIITATTGVVTYYGDGSQLSGILGLEYVNLAGVSTSVIGGIASVTSLSVSGVSTLGTVYISSGIVTVGIASITSLSVSGVSTLGTVQISSGIVSATSGVVTYYGDGSKLLGVSTTGYANLAGISTNVIGGIASVTSLSVSGISTLGTVYISSGIVTATTGVVTYYGDGSKLSGIITSISYVDKAGISTNVIGGIASVTSLSVSGVSTLGTVYISSGIVTATTGVVTYYGDGSKLLGVSTTGLTVSVQPVVSYAVYPTLASAAGVGTIGIFTTGLSYVPSSSKFGIGTDSPRENIDVIGSIGIQTSGSANRFYLQHNSLESSLDFMFI